ncbi:hypothetical protein PAPYR_13397 [Paratrimastix pyriformis]|uniref:Uncharacterized protein n=1 Tax=Paratrimastix pyriformis TaxID=342808 RepID=A0ABQ8U3U7_9EUKA|nr:hypothetical protein PAPYR_13397 [Paratrimastix pyriformis]
MGAAAVPFNFPNTFGTPRGTGEARNERVSFPSSEPPPLHVRTHTKTAIFPADLATATEADHDNHQKSRWDALLPMARNWAIRPSRSLWGASIMLAILKQLMIEIWVKTADLVPSSLMDHLAHFDDQPVIDSRKWDPPSRFRWR